MAALVTTGARGQRVGVAISSTNICAVIRRAGSPRAEPWRASLAPLNGDLAGWSGLTDALRSLARDAGGTGRLTVALMPPLAEARGVELPPLRDDEMQTLLARGASRYFVGARGPQIVGVVRVDARGAGNAPTVAAAAGARLVAALYESARASGWTIEAIIPAEAAWGAAAAQWASRAKGDAQLLVAHADRTDLLRLERGKLVGLRRFRGGASDAAVIAEAFSASGGRLSIVGSADARRELSNILSTKGIAVEAAPARDFADDPELLAAAFATPDADPKLLTESARTARATTIRQVTMRFVVAASVLVVAAVALQWWGLRRELASIKAQRAEIAPQISLTLVGKSTVENAFKQLQVLNAQERAAPRWSSTIAAISSKLPSDAFLTGFRGRGDSVSVDGLAHDAARVYDAVEKVPGLAGVHSSAQVRIESPNDGPAMQRFAIAATVARPDAKKPAPPAVAKPPAAAPAKGGAK